MKVTEVLVELLGLLLRRHAVYPRRPVLAGAPVRLLQEFLVDQVCQCREHSAWLTYCLRRNLLEFR